MNEAKFNRIVIRAAVGFVLIVALVTAGVVVGFYRDEAKKTDDEIRFEAIFSQVKPQMSESEVTRLLGKPEFEEPRTGGTQWFYPGYSRDYYVLFTPEHKVEKTESQSI